MEPKNVVATTTSDDNNIFRYAAPVLGWVMSGNGAEYGHLKNSILNFPSISEWTALMEGAGKTCCAFAGNFLVVACILVVVFLGGFATGIADE